MSRMTVLAPGRWGGDSAPWMMYSSEAAVRRGSERRAVVWDISAELALAETASAVRGQVTAVLDDVTGTVVTAVEHFLDSIVWR